jgi:hypothetical protein
MIKSVLWTFALLLFQSIASRADTALGLIQGASLWYSHSSSVLFHGDCQQCLCQLYLNKNFSSFNCYTNNQTCRLHLKSDQNRSFQLIHSAVTIFYFLSLPSFQSTIITPSCRQNLNCSAGKMSLLLNKSLCRDRDSTCAFNAKETKLILLSS